METEIRSTCGNRLTKKTGDGCLAKCVGTFPQPPPEAVPNVVPFSVCRGITAFATMVTSNKPVTLGTSGCCLISPNSLTPVSLVSPCPMTKTESPQIPADFVAFAHAVADIAEANAIDTFTLKFKPDFMERGLEDPRSEYGEITINYTKRDDRGRPCKNLNIWFDAHVRLPLISTASSY